MRLSEASGRVPLPKDNLPTSDVSSSPAPATVTHTSGFAGLANQGATCYMNSLLQVRCLCPRKSLLLLIAVQTLFMTPELRKLIYELKIPEGDEDSIPSQLRTLFGKLQLSKSAISTRVRCRSASRRQQPDPVSGFDREFWVARSRCVSAARCARTLSCLI